MFSIYDFIIYNDGITIIYLFPRKDETGQIAKMRKIALSEETTQYQVVLSYFEDDGNFYVTIDNIGHNKYITVLTFLNSIGFIVDLVPCLETGKTFKFDKRIVEDSLILKTPKEYIRHASNVELIIKKMRTELIDFSFKSKLL